MKSLLTDVVRQTAPLFDKVRVIGSETGTRVEAYSDIMLYLEADLNAVPELVGEFGLSNLGLLRSLLDFASYKADDAKFVAHRMSRDGKEYVTELEFRDAAGGGARYKTMNSRMLPKRAIIEPIRWGIKVTPSKAKLTEVIQLTTMLSQVEQHFSVLYEGSTLFLTIGGKGAASHNASVALASDVEPYSLPCPVVFRAPFFLSVLKNAGNLPCTIQFDADYGIAGIVVETDHGVYTYILRGTAA